MYHKKKIAVFISHIYGDYQEKFLAGFGEKAEELGYPMEIYATNDGEDLGNYDLGEKSILNIPNFNDIAGIIYVSGTYTDQVLKEKVREKITDSGCPVVEVTQSDAVFPCVKLENNTQAEDITRHLFTVHSCKRVCYLGHSGIRFYSDKREAAYKKAFEDMHTYPGEYDIFLCDGTEESYHEALSHFEKGGRFDAVVAYNDTIAIGFMEQAMLKGYKIPDDFAITGFDCLEAGQNVTPALTTVSFPLEEVGKKSLETLVNLINGKHVPIETIHAAPIYNESCGCKKCASLGAFGYLQNRNRKIAELEHSMFESMKMSAALSKASDIDEGAEIIADFAKTIPDINEFYLCLYQDWNAIRDPILALALDEDEIGNTSDEAMILKVGIKNGKRIPECSYEKSSLLPDFVSPDQNKAFVVSPLFFGERAFGYIAMSFKSTRISFKFEHVQWIMNIARFLRDCCEYERSGLLSRHLEELYLRDALTGLLNRHGFSSYFDKCTIKTSNMTLVLFDLDGLKNINDTYGHEEGDFALKTIGQAILRSAGPDDICARFGGDEFYCLLLHDDKDYPDKFNEHVDRFLNNFNALSEKSYKISACHGHETISSATFSDISSLLKAADEKLYIAKKAR